MKSRESLVRLKEFQVKDKRRQLAQLQLMMSEFERMSKELESQITQNVLIYLQQQLLEK